VILACLNCGTRISGKWLFLGLPWSTYTCPRCGSMFAGTLLRLVLTSLGVGVFGYVLIAVVKGRMCPGTLIVPGVIAFGLLTLKLPRQLREVGEHGAESS